jgi:hypothetical protein
MFAKLERRHFGFFDKAGWYRIPLPHQCHLDGGRAADLAAAATISANRVAVLSGTAPEIHAGG